MQERAHFDGSAQAELKPKLRAMLFIEERKIKSSAKLRSQN
jgi:hypothetical protein